MTTVVAPAMDTIETTTRPHQPIWRIVRLHAVNPSIFFGIPWVILAFAWAVTMVVAVILRSSGVDPENMAEGFRYSWAVLAPQWYLIVVGVQALSFTFPFALGFGATRRDFWLGTSAMFVLVSCEMAIAIATLVKIEIVTGGWGIGAGMFDALWYGQHGWLTDFYTTFCLQLLVLFIGASITTTYMRWRVRGMLVLTVVAAVVALAVVATLSLTGSWLALFTWLSGIGIAGVFTLVLGLAGLCAVAGYLVLRRATTR